jgi:hypothetical protein
MWHRVVWQRNSVFWDITPYSPVKVNWHFRVTYCLQLQGWRVSQARNQQEWGSKQSSTLCWFLAWLIFILKIEVICSSEMLVDFQKTELLTATTVRTSNPTQSDRSSQTFQRNLLLPCSGWKSKSGKQSASRVRLLAVSCWLFAWLNSPDLKTEAVVSPNTSVNYQTYYSTNVTGSPSSLQRVLLKLI